MRLCLCFVLDSKAHYSISVDCYCQGLFLVSKEGRLVSSNNIYIYIYILWLSAIRLRKFELRPHVVSLFRLEYFLWFLVAFFLKFSGFFFF